MFDFFATLTFFVISAPTIANLMAITDTEIVANKSLSSDSHKLVELEKQNKTIFSLAEYKNELYIGMEKGNLAKINSNGKITQIPIIDEDEIKNITSMKKLNDSLYLAALNKLLELKPNGEIKRIFKDASIIDFLEAFNNELYFSIISKPGSNNYLMKMDSNANFSKVLTLPLNFSLSELKTINNHLYFVISDGNNSEINTLNSIGEIKKIAVMLNKQISYLIEFKNEIYICLDNGSLYIINNNGEIKEVIERNLFREITTLFVFQDELYIANWNKLEKLTKDNKIETIAEAPEIIFALATFNNELYIGMDEGYFAKLT